MSYFKSTSVLWSKYSEDFEKLKGCTLVNDKGPASLHFLTLLWIFNIYKMSHVVIITDES